jgi:malate dehydrogenase (oxaloacetate-decarboxylating)
MTRVSASFSATLRVRLRDRPGAFAELARAIGDTGASLEAIDLVRAEPGVKIRDVTVLARDAEHIREVAAAAGQLENVEVEHVSDRTFLMHLGGKIEVALKAPLATRDDLSMAYTPGVARVSQAIADDPEKAWSLTIKRNTVAVVSDGTAVLGLGDIGPEAAMPVMEGKAMLLKEFAGIDAWPVCLATTDTDEIVTVVTAIAPAYGAINLEDISAPRCFEIEERLRASLDIPVFHDDQHGTAIVVYAALLNALRVVGKRPEDVKVVFTGVGAAGIATTRILQRAGVGTIVGCDRQGAVYSGRPGLAGVKADYAEETNPERERGSADEVLRGADVYIGLSRPGAVSVDGIRSMADDAIVFVMANPTPEVPPDELAGLAAVLATGRSDYPNQVNNVLAFPGVFRGALDVRARDITEGMKLAAGEAIAGVVGADELGPEYIVPSVFNREVVRVVASAVAEAAEHDGVARRHREAAPFTG